MVDMNWLRKNSCKFKSRASPIQEGRVVWLAVRCGGPSVWFAKVIKWLLKKDEKFFLKWASAAR